MALARAGVASRRHAEALIEAGRVQVNGRVVAALGTRVDLDVDAIAVDDRPLRPAPAARVYLALHKPPGYLATVHDPHGRPTVMALVPAIPGLVPVGRLDADSEGLLLLTNDGAWAHRLSHPRYGASKEYLVEVRGVPSPAALARLRRPMALPPDDHSSGAQVEVDGTTPDGARLRIVLHEGRKRQLRRMLAAVGHPVQRLIRVQVGAVRLGRLRPGTWRRLTAVEVAGAVGVDQPLRKRSA